MAADDASARPPELRCHGSELAERNGDGLVIEASPAALSSDHLRVEGMVAMLWAGGPRLRELVRPLVVHQVFEDGDQHLLSLISTDVLVLAGTDWHRDEAPRLPALAHLTTPPVVSVDDSCGYVVETDLEVSDQPSRQLGAELRRCHKPSMATGNQSCAQMPGAERAVDLADAAMCAVSLNWSDIERVWRSMAAPRLSLGQVDAPRCDYVGSRQVVVGACENK